MRNLVLISLIIIFGCQSLKTTSQDPKRYENQIRNFQTASTIQRSEEPLLVFTGSSSIRRWENLTTLFPGFQVIKTGFGGSTMNDLEYYINEAILQYKPNKIFIYEGDNDVKLGVKQSKILRSTRSIIEKIRFELPTSEIILISVKPSLDRWYLKDKYLELNKELYKLSKDYDTVHYLDMWDTMLAENGEPIAQFFVEDGIHLNEKGYQVWKIAIQDYLDKNTN